jgi:hypothetical protein
MTLYLSMNLSQVAGREVESEMRIFPELNNNGSDLG